MCTIRFGASFFPAIRSQRLNKFRFQWLVMRSCNIDNRYTPLLPFLYILPFLYDVEIWTQVRRWFSVIRTNLTAGLCYARTHEACLSTILLYLDLHLLCKPVTRWPKVAGFKAKWTSVSGGIVDSVEITARFSGTYRIGKCIIYGGWPNHTRLSSKSNTV